MHFYIVKSRNQSEVDVLPEPDLPTNTVIFDRLILHLKVDIFFSRFLDELLKSIYKLCIIR